MRTKYFILSILLLSALNLYSFEDTINKISSRINIGLGYNYNMHKADFNKLGEIPNCCPKFENGSGTGLNLMLSYDELIAKNLFLSIGADFSDLSGTLEHQEQVNFGINGEKVSGIINYKVVSKLIQAGLNTQIKANIFSDLYFHIGGRLAYFVTPDFTQSEEIISPSSGVGYSNTDSKIRNNYSGEIPKANKLQYGALSGLSYDIYLDKARKFIITPSVNFNYSLSNIAQNISWKVHFINGSLGIKYHFYKEKEEIIPEIKKIEPPKIDTPIVVQKTPEPPKDTVKPIEEIKPLPPPIEVQISHVGLDRDGNEIPNLKIFKFEEFLTSNVQPLLSYIFFDANSSDFINRLNILDENSSQSFNLKNLKNFDALDTYKEILNIIAIRMKNLPKANITLTGCNSDNGDEKNNINLSKKRAETVKNYLVNVWKINPNRINILSRNLPEKPSNTSTNDGNEENRRVEISSDTEELLEPIISYDTLRDANPPTARFKININAQLKNWKLTVFNQSKPIKEFTGNNSYPNIIDWKIDKDLIKSNILWNDLTYKIDIEDTAGQQKSSELIKINVETETIINKKEKNMTDKTIDKYSLILFDFNSSQLTKANKKIADLIKSRIKPESDISIYGYADRSGNEKRNEQLALERANVTRDAIERKDSKIFPIGSKQLIYDNDLPEGRFYSRTVSIIVETPIKK